MMIVLFIPTSWDIVSVGNIRWSDGPCPRGISSSERWREVLRVSHVLMWQRMEEDIAGNRLGAWSVSLFYLGIHGYPRSKFHWWIHWSLMILSYCKSLFGIQQKPQRAIAIVGMVQLWCNWRLTGSGFVDHGVFITRDHEDGFLMGRSLGVDSERWRTLVCWGWVKT